MSGNYDFLNLYNPKTNELVNNAELKDELDFDGQLAEIVHELDAYLHNDKRQVA